MFLISYYYAVFLYDLLDAPKLVKPKCIDVIVLVQYGLEGRAENSSHV